MPSAEAVNVLPPPLMLAAPEMPDVASLAEAEAVTVETYQPFDPSTGGRLRLKVGGRLSTLIETEAFVEVSPKLDRTQKSRLVLPSGKVQAQDGALHNVPGVPSKVVRLKAGASGSLPERERVAVPRHQPALPGRLQVVVPEAVAGG
jgi:hypothetical protein